jgi:hypothetical protein
VLGHAAVDLAIASSLQLVCSDVTPVTSQRRARPAAPDLAIASSLPVGFVAM